jgi:hypothetical protein
VVFLGCDVVFARRAGFFCAYGECSVSARARAPHDRLNTFVGTLGKTRKQNECIGALRAFARLLGWPFLGCSECLCAACGLLAVCVGICARASFPTAAEVRLWALREQHMCKQDHWCVWGVCKAARVAFLGLQRVFVRGVRAFGGLCRHLCARELPNGSRGAFVGTQRTAHVQTRSFVCSGCLQGC